MSAANAPATAAASKALAGIKIIDCDAHYTEPPDLWTSRAPAALKDRVPHMRTVDGVSKWFIEGDTEFGTIGASVVNRQGGKLVGKISYDNYEQMHRGSSEVKPRLELMDQFGIWAQIIYPNAAGFSSAKFMTMQDPELRLACLRAYNDAIAEWQQESGGRLLGQALLPMWDSKALVAELQRATEDLKLTGVTVADKPEALGLPGYDTDHFRGFFEYCNAKRVPINFHIGAASGIDAWAASWNSYGMEKSVAIASALFYLSNAATISNFIYSGLFDTYPNLKMVSVESGIGWIPFLLEFLDYGLKEMAVHEAAHLQRRPKDYFRDHFYACFWFEKYAPSKMVEEIGVNNILFETDFPHPTCLYPESVAHIEDTMGDLPFAVRKRILQDNAVELYGIKV